MTFVTTLTLESGDRAVLDDVVSEIATLVERKGAQMKGPHPSPPRSLSVPQYRRLAEGERYSPWRYTVYTRTIEIVGHDQAARTVAGREYPDSVHIEAEVEQVKPLGHRNA
jgi:small subunit ribosomal protein S10